ncbi:MAG TPA: gluconate 2-dehydrogenase subunit 3 family protein [Lacunisphaera sp.]
MHHLPRIDRRTAIKWMLAASATMAIDPRFARAESAAAPSGKGYGTDPDLMRHYKPGELWPLTLTEAQRRTTAALCDVIIPADDHSPAASTVGVVDFIDEWISAPYEEQQRDREVILPGVAWIDAEATKRFGQSFAGLSEANQAAICDDICSSAKAKPEFKSAAKFFSVFRHLAAGGFYTTPVGMKDLRYVGNVPLATFDGPPPEALRHAGLL